MLDPLARSAFSRDLKNQAEFLKIREDSKAPVSSFKPGKRNRYKRIPKMGNYGILPINRLMVLDMDINKGGTLEAQIPLFSLLLGVDLTTTRTVATPSGGRHFYLYLPLSTLQPSDLPKTNLRTFQAEIEDLTGQSVTVDADIRSEAANAYVIGPGSTIKTGSYTLIHDGAIKEISEEGFANLVALKALKLKRKKDLKAAAEVDLWQYEPLPPVVPGSQVSQVPGSKSLQKLDRALKTRNYMTFHQQRAFVKAALHCCYSNDAIVLACVALGVNKDSASSKTINRFALQKDIHAFVPEECFHGPYCPVGMEKQVKNKEPMSEKAFQKHLDRLVLRREVRQATDPDKLYRRVDPRVIDMDRVSKALLKHTKRGVHAKQYVAAMAIVESMLQPLTNVGAEKVLLSRSFLSQELALTESQVAQGLRILRAAGVVEVRDRQKQGFAPTYVVHPQFINKKLTFHLRRTWVELKSQGEEASLVFDPREGGFVKALTREPVFTNSLAAAIGRQYLGILTAYAPEPHRTTALEAYLKSESSVS